MDSSSFSNPNSCESTSAASNRRRKEQERKKKVAGTTPGAPAVKLSTDPQSVAARQRRHRISDRFKILQSMVPGGSNMDTVSMLEEVIQYVKFLKAQIWLHQAIISLDDSNNINNNADHDDHTLFTQAPLNVNCAELGSHDHQKVHDVRYDYNNYGKYQAVRADQSQLGLQESWFQGQEIGPFDTTSTQNDQL